MIEQLPVTDFLLELTRPKIRLQGLMVAYVTNVRNDEQPEEYKNL